jgi:hypothetical protein
MRGQNMMRHERGIFFGSKISGTRRLALLDHARIFEQLRIEENLLREILKLGPELVTEKGFDETRKQLELLVDEKIEVMQQYSSFLEDRNG